MTEVKFVKISKDEKIKVPKIFSNYKKEKKAIIFSDNKKIIKKPTSITIEFATLSEKALSECWDSKEDEISFAHLQ